MKENKTSSSAKLKRKEKRKKAETPDLLQKEKELWAAGYTAIAGIDEVGRGCLFGDVVAAAVILPADSYIEEINDSKKLTEKKREALFETIMNEAVAVGIGRVDVQTIERINIKQAARLAMKLAVEELALAPDYLLIDAEKVDLSFPQEAVIHGDELSQSIAAASIVAKVTRDRLCAEWDGLYPGYGIAGHKGYATKEHREQIRLLGPTPLHRSLFLRNILMEQQTLF
ncbi:ribonuclease HII [Paenibacillus larvae]|uniref:Ribonuclease HII n=2 Tax=Paenibacillus larvae TaxID=1464 RepID=A0A2L1U1U5_9BACL|nr:ribonuclease HII [Paenibacillus larvae]AQR76510.1 ribonuclease HII [Paenibacillus larvae subsp. larvae]AQZ48805.1 ribonuclease HII [Paenibacillus larvae subsp. pulvifaciens]ARF69895.1 ribonuclease HII [Paenibacillus larvae subsp. pulvifaciens]AVF22643.1 ribonuclease HII [Paenibacillus larvae subsp. larvae]AVF26901.1 ribonuclease HII [Paenibacillus larvae subsp. larvae]